VQNFNILVGNQSVCIVVKYDASTCVQFAEICILQVCSLRVFIAVLIIVIWYVLFCFMLFKNDNIFIRS